MRKGVHLKVPTAFSFLFSAFGLNIPQKIFIWSWGLGNWVHSDLPQLVEETAAGLHLCPRMVSVEFPSGTAL